MYYNLIQINSHVKKKNTYWISSLKIAFLSFVLQGNHANVHGAETAGWLLTSVGSSIAGYFVPDSVKETVVQYASWITGEEKKYTEQFNEFTANRRMGDLSDLYSKSADEIKFRLLKNFPVPKLEDTKSLKSFPYTKCTQYVTSWELLYQNYVLAILRKDYSDALKHKMETVIEEIKKLDLKQLQEKTKGTRTEEDDQREMISFLEKKKLNICANIYAKYHYERDGGLWDKGKTSMNSKAARKKFWGTRGIPAVIERENPTYINDILNSGDEISVRANPILEIYKEVITFIKLEDALFFEDFDNNVALYRNKYLEFFNSHATATPLMDPTLVEYTNFLMSNNKMSKRHTQSSQDGSASFPLLTPTSAPIPITGLDNALGSYLKGCTPTQSFSAQQDPLFPLFPTQEVPKTITQTILEKEKANHSKESSGSTDESSDNSSETHSQSQTSSHGTDDSQTGSGDFWESNTVNNGQFGDNA